MLLVVSLVGGALAAAPAGLAPMADDAVAGVAPSIPVEHYTLPNGLDVMLHVDRSAPQVVVNLWYDVGSKDELPGRSGFAHLFEHLMFMGTTRLPGAGFDEQMEAHGGWNNAWTSEDATDYFEVGPSHLLPLFLWMEADRMDGLSHAMTRQKLALQREVVRNERRQSDEDTPYGVVWLALPTALYPEGHPYAHPVIGSHEDLQAATVQDVKDFFATWYVPSNASLVVAGDFEPAAVKPEIERLFGSIPAGTPPARTPPAPVDLPARPLVELTDQVAVPKAWFAWHTVPVFAPGDAAHDIVASVLSGGRAARLHRRLVVDSQVAQEVSAAHYSQAYGGVFLVEITPADGQTLESVEAAVQAEIDRLATEGPTPEELARVRTNLQTDALRGLESLQDRASALNRYFVTRGEPDSLAWDLSRTAAVDAEAVKAAAARLTVARRATLRVRPEAAATPEAK